MYNNLSNGGFEQRRVKCQSQGDHAKKTGTPLNTRLIRIEKKV